MDINKLIKKGIDQASAATDIPIEILKKPYSNSNLISKVRVAKMLEEQARVDRYLAISLVPAIASCVAYICTDMYMYEVAGKIRCYSQAGPWAEMLNAQNIIHWI